MKSDFNETWIEEALAQDASGSGSEFGETAVLCNYIFS